MQTDASLKISDLKMRNEFKLLENMTQGSNTQDSKETSQEYGGDY